MSEVKTEVPLPTFELPCSTTEFEMRVLKRVFDSTSGLDHIGAVGEELEHLGVEVEDSHRMVSPTLKALLRKEFESRRMLDKEKHTPSFSPEDFDAPGKATSK